jgi:hypothetical protein
MKSFDSPPNQTRLRAVAPFTGPTSAVRGSQPVHRTRTGCTRKSTRPPDPQVASTRQEDGSKDGLKDGAKPWRPNRGDPSQ